MATKITKENRINVVSLRVNVCNYESAAQRVLEIVERKSSGYVCVSTVHMTMEAYQDSAFAKIVNNADLVTPDGMPMVWMTKLQGAKNGSRVRGKTLMVKLFDLAQKNNLKIGFYGGKQETLDKMAENIRSEYTDLEISYIYSPPFRALTTEEDAEITEAIGKSGTDILFVGLGCPKQEHWMAAHPVNAVMIGVGAAFDFYAGNIAEAPQWMQRIGLEWLFRLTQDPRRLWRRYVILNPQFMWLAFLQLTGLKKFDLQK